MQQSKHTLLYFQVPLWSLWDHGFIWWLFKKIIISSCTYKGRARVCASQGFSLHSNVKQGPAGTKLFLSSLHSWVTEFCEMKWFACGCVGSGEARNGAGISGDPSSQPVSFCSSRQTPWFLSDLLFRPWHSPAEESAGWHLHWKQITTAPAWDSECWVFSRKKKIKPHFL